MGTVSIYNSNIVYEAHSKFTFTVPFWLGLSHLMRPLKLRARAPNLLYSSTSAMLPSLTHIVPETKLANAMVPWRKLRVSTGFHGHFCDIPPVNLLELLILLSFHWRPLVGDGLCPLWLMNFEVLKQSSLNRCFWVRCTIQFFHLSSW